MKPSEKECCIFVAAQIRALGYHPYADRILELVKKSLRLETELKALKPEPAALLKPVQGKGTSAQISDIKSSTS